MTLHQDLDPSYFRPMLAKELARGEDGKPILPCDRVVEDWRMEPKLDGWRFMAHVDDLVTWFGGRNGAIHTSASLTALSDTLRACLPPDTVLDGEIIVPAAGASSGDVSTALASGQPVEYWVFDILRLNGTDTRDLSYEKRRQLLQTIEWTYPPIKLVPSVPINQTLYEAWVTDGPLEGVMVKHLAGRYESGKRSRKMLKGKPQMSLDCKIIGFVAAKLGWAGQIGAIEVEITDGNYVEQYGEGRTTRVACPPWLSTQILHGGQFAQSDAPRADWIGRMIEVRYSLMFKGGTPRHPVFAGLREDRDDA